MPRSKTLALRNLRGISIRKVFGLDVRFLQAPGELGGLTACHVTMPPGSVHPAAYHKERDELVFVLEGSGLMTVGGRRKRLKPGDIVYIPAKCVHQVDTGPDGLRVMSIFDPAMLKKPDIVLVEDAGHARGAKRKK